MKKATAVVCTFALLLSLSSCGIEKPDTTKESNEQTSADVKDIKKFNIKDSHVRADLSDSFVVDADISGNDIKSVASYDLDVTKLTEDRIAELVMADGGYKREDKADGMIEYASEREKLDVQLIDTSSMSFMTSPSFTYSLDKGKEYKALVDYYWLTETARDIDEINAIDLVKEKLDKLPFEYGDMFIYKMDCDTMNSVYAERIAEQQKIVKEAGSAGNEADRSFEADLYLMGKYDLLDENLQFTSEDECYIINGKLTMKDLPVYSWNYQISSIYAAVSSRGIEYLKVDNLYSLENAHGESAAVDIEKAADALYQAFESSSYKDKNDITVDKIDLAYQKDNYTGDDPREHTKEFISPVWAIHYLIKPKNGNELDGRTCIVSATDGTMLSKTDELFSPNQILLKMTE